MSQHCNTDTSSQGRGGIPIWKWPGIAAQFSPQAFVQPGFAKLSEFLASREWVREDFGCSVLEFYAGFVVQHSCLAPVKITEHAAPERPAQLRAVPPVQVWATECKWPAPVLNRPALAQQLRVFACFLRGIAGLLLRNLT